MHYEQLTCEERQRLDAICDRFETAWLSGERPDIGGYIQYSSGAERLATLHELIILDIGYRWRSGNHDTQTFADASSFAEAEAIRQKSCIPSRPRLADYVLRFPELSPVDSLPVALICEEFRVLNELGQCPSVEEYAKQFPGRPDLGAALADAVDERAAGTESSREPPGMLGSIDPPYSAGRFHVLRRHATGGLGRVSIARDDELKREVALKEIQERFAHDPNCRARLVREASITSRLEHPGVVPVYGLGQHDNGEPYYAMRFVRGASMKDAIDEFISIPDSDDSGNHRVEMFKLLRRLVVVCNTMDYAHSRGIIHRDIKPDNIMLGEYGETLVVDWGLSKAEDEPVSCNSDTDSQCKPDEISTAETQEGTLVGTPAYMSPEQTRGSEHATAASDIYSLGATLYHLLTGRPPFSGERFADLLTKIQAGDYDPPREILNSTPKPLEAICLKAMNTSPADRYVSAGNMADDLDRWLAGQPVTAYVEPFSLRARRWIKRHRILVTTAAVAIVLIAIFMTIVSAVVADRNQALRTKNRDLYQANETSRLERMAALQARDQTRSVLKYLTYVFRSADPAVDGRTVTVAESLAQAHSQTAQDFGDQPVMKAEILHAIGQTFDSLGVLEAAIDSFEEAYQLREMYLGTEHPDTLTTLSSLAAAYHAAGDARARPTTQRAYKLRVRVLGADHPDTMRSHQNLAVILMDAGELKNAIAILEDLRRKKMPEDVLRDPHDLDPTNNLAVAYQRGGMWKKALPLFEESHERRRATFGEDDPRTLTAAFNLATMLRDSGERTRAREILTMVVPKCQSLLGKSHSKTLSAECGLAIMYLNSGELKKARSQLEGIHRRCSESFGSTHPNTLEYAGNLANAYYMTNDLRKAIELQTDILKTYLKTKGGNHPLAMKMMSNLAASHLANGDAAEAQSLFVQALDLRRPILGDDHPDTIVSMINLVAAQHASGEYEKAEPLCREVLSRAQKTLGKSHHLTLVALARTGENAMMRGDYTEAETLCRSCLELREKSMPQHWLRYHAMSLLGAALIGQERFVEAEELLVTGYTELKARESSIPYPARSQITKARKRVVQLYEEWGNPDDAEPYREEMEADGQ